SPTVGICGVNRGRGIISRPHKAKLNGTPGPPRDRQRWRERGQFIGRRTNRMQREDRPGAIGVRISGQALATRREPRWKADTTRVLWLSCGCRTDRFATFPAVVSDAEDNPVWPVDLYELFLSRPTHDSPGRHFWCCRRLRDETDSHSTAPWRRDK